jgi:hypothetical protein
MKRIMSAIVAALVSVAFAGIAFAAEPETTTEPASPETYQTVKPEAAKKPVAKKKHHKKKSKKPVKKSGTKAPEEPAAPAAPEAPPAQ